MHPATKAILKFFEYSHLPPHLQEISRPFYDLAHRFARMETEDGPELTAGLRKLLEAKDCMVRAGLTQSSTQSSNNLLTVIRRVHAAGYIGGGKPCNISVIRKTINEAGKESNLEVTEDEIRSALEYAGITVTGGNFQESHLLELIEASGRTAVAQTEAETERYESLLLS